MLMIGVVLLTMHQYSIPVGECITDLKSVQPEIEVAPLTAIKVIFSDSLVEFCNAIIAILLFRFTSRKEDPGNFSSRSYMTAAALIPFCLGLYFHSEKVGSCIVDADGHLTGAPAVGGTSTGGRQFPIAVLYHGIVTGCFWFMNYYMDQCDKNLNAVAKLHKELSSKNSRKKK
jgi:hypothetical protein